MSKQKWGIQERNASTWCAEMIESIQKSFKDISIIGLGSISWNGCVGDLERAKGEMEEKAEKHKHLAW